MQLYMPLCFKQKKNNKKCSAYDVRRDSCVGFFGCWFFGVLRVFFNTVLARQADLKTSAK